MAKTTKEPTTEVSDLKTRTIALESVVKQILERSMVAEGGMFSNAEAAALIEKLAIVEDEPSEPVEDADGPEAK